MFQKYLSMLALAIAVGSAALAEPVPAGFHAVGSNTSPNGKVHTDLYVGHPLSVINPFTLPGYETPASIRAIYNIPTTAQGSDAIAVIDCWDDPVALHDFNTYAAAGGFPLESSTNVTASTNKVFQVVYAEGVKPPVDPNGKDQWDLEESADFEVCHGFAPKAKIYLVEAKDTDFNSVYHAFQVATKLLGVREIGQSFGANEDSTITKLSYQTTGIAVFSASGDDGISTSFPATSPYNIGVGGTQFNLVAGKFAGEIAWAGSGGGISGFFTRPSYENNVQNIVGGQRGNPDISADGFWGTGVEVYDSNNPLFGWFPVGGTSVSCQIIAALSNLAGKHQNSYAENQAIYAALGTSKLRDITSGGFYKHAAPGYDLITGCGVPNGLAAL